MSAAAKIVLALCLVLAGFAGGVKYTKGVEARRLLAAATAAESDRIQQRKFSDKVAGQHASTVAKLSTQLGDARVQISKMPGRECLVADTVSLLNAIGAQPGGTPASEPASAPEAATAGGGFRFSTDRDAGTAIATCRAWYGAVADQLNQILDIEDQRHPPIR